MPTTVFGLPTHALVIHATVMLVPLAASLLVLVALWPRLRRALGPLPAFGAAVALILVPITTSSGEKLKDKLGVDNPLIDRHAELGKQLLPWVAALFVAALVLLFTDGWRPNAWATPAPATGAGGGVATASRMRIVTIVISVIVIALAVVTVVEVIRIGHAGAEAVWQGVGSS